MAPTVLIVPGLRDHVPAHWQTLLAAQLPRVRSVPPMGRTGAGLDRAARVAAIEREARAIAGPLVLVAHSAGCAAVAHWARHTRRAVQGALLATPPELDQPVPPGYPPLQALQHGGWLPVPMAPLPFPCIVAASRNDPLARFEQVARMAQAWGARLADLGPVGHLNPASGHGAWPDAQAFIAELSNSTGHTHHGQSHPLL
ncbi:MAG TPA: alpha/beta hydrolase [Pseudorhodoferax sp.]|nr:alpha/beta hydrolase [Pseudorhodoferax sp.]